METEKDELAALKQEVATLKAAIAPAGDAQADAEWRARMHRLAEERMGHASAFSREDVRAMERACPTEVVRDIVAHGTIPEPGGYGVRGAGEVRGPSGVSANNSGWRDADPIRPPLGVAALDRIADAMAPHGPMNPLNPLAEALRAKQEREDKAKK
jgi:hypothetical protein